MTVKKHMKSGDSMDATRRYMNSPELKPEMTRSSAVSAAPVRESVDYGSDQGGLFSWFRGLFGGKKKERKTVSSNASMPEIKEPSTAATATMSVPEGKKDDWEEVYAPYAGEQIDLSRVGTVNQDRDNVAWLLEGKGKLDATARGRLPKKNAGIGDRYREKYGDEAYAALSGNVALGGGKTIGGLNVSRILASMEGELGDDMSDEKMFGLLHDMSAVQRDGDSTQSRKDVFSGLKAMKGVYYGKLKRLEATFGTAATDLHPEDFVRQIPDYAAFSEHFGFIQDCLQLLGAQEKNSFDEPLFDFSDNKDKEFRDLTNYYYQVKPMVMNYLMNYHDMGTGKLLEDEEDPEYYRNKMDSDRDLVLAEAAKMETRIQGPGMTEKEAKKYRKGLKSRAKKGGWMNKLFGIFR
ncbi:MAG: hypothetical protein IK115_03550 [Lachnospiraceae bacterium]|nr:hypothetical protein [Lachnospiraceae bacterium]